MKQIKLKRCRQDNAILLDHEFIDQYMPEANGEYVKSLSPSAPAFE